MNVEFSGDAKTTIRGVKMSSYEQSVYLRETREGHWIIQDEKGRKGGRFVDRRAAIKYIRRELGLRAQPVSAMQSDDAAGARLPLRTPGRPDPGLD